jgi:beta-mannosidase
MKLNATRVESPGESITGLAGELLDAGWKLSRHGDGSRYYDAVVPGNVHSTLLAAGVIPDPFIGQNNEQSKWIADSTWDYHYTLNLGSTIKKTLDEFPDGGLAHVLFEAVDYDGSFIVDGRCICRQVGMFSPVDLAFGITPGAPEAGTEVPITVRFNVQPWWRQHAVKCQMAFGWDFAPELRTVGIWKHVRLYHTGPAMFSQIFVHAEKMGNAPGTVSSSTTASSAAARCSILGRWQSCRVPIVQCCG